MIRYLENLNIFLLLIILIISIFLLSKSADFLVKSAVAISRSFGVSEIIIGATIVSIGTTLPEFTSSTMAALKGLGGFSLGNSVGSTITNICLVLGVGALFGVLPVNKRSSKSHLILSVLMVSLILISIPTKSINRITGIVFFACVPLYILYIIKSEKKEIVEIPQKTEGKLYKKNLIRIIFIIVSAVLVSFFASALTNTVEIIANRVGISDAIISSTIVALGTSLPELSTVIASAKKGYGELAVGNVMGANILNIIFVLGSSLIFSPKAITVPDEFFFIHFPASIVGLLIFGYLIYNEKNNVIKKSEGMVLIFIYLIYISVNVFFIN